MQLAVGIVFFNPIFMLAYNFLAWYFLGVPGLAIALLAPIVLWAIQKGSEDPKGLLKYLAGMQTFYLSCLIGGIVIYYGIEASSILMVIGGAFLLLPALTVAAAVILFS